MEVEWRPEPPTRKRKAPVLPNGDSGSSPGVPRSDWAKVGTKSPKGRRYNGLERELGKPVSTR